MAHREVDKIVIDGSAYSDLEMLDGVGSQCGNLWTFLTQTVPFHPWIAGLASVVGVVWVGTDQPSLVQVAAIVGVTVITVASTWKWRSYERSKTASEFDDVRSDEIKNRGPEGEARQRLSVGSDPPIG